MSQDQKSSRRLARRLNWETILAVLLVIAIGGGGVLNQDFLTPENWSNLLANFVEIALLALPLSLIVITKEIDLSVASILGFPVVCSDCYGRSRWPCRWRSSFACS